MPAGSWFDPKRLKRIAYNDEPVWVFGKPTDAHLAHRFTKPESTCCASKPSQARAGRITATNSRSRRATLPQDLAHSAKAGWDERGWTRRLDSDALESACSARRQAAQTSRPSKPIARRPSRRRSRFPARSKARC